MKDICPDILIIGGGVAGMSAALALKHQNFIIHLVEREKDLGGHAASWACMATKTCQNCGACLASEMAAKIKNTKNVIVHLNTRLTALNQTREGVEVMLSSGKTLTPAKTLIATGFSPFNPGLISSFHTHTQKKVVTTARLNTLIREEKIKDFIGPSPKIAFLQCVGSRNKKENRDYCSQVCCKISMRQANKLVHLIPNADISLFYMDLQIMGKEARKTANALADNVQLIQGVPGEILEKNSRLTMVIEDPVSLSRQSREFDLVVLSVGMVPDQENDALAGLLNLTPNAWGFFNTEETALGQDIYMAGCAKGPKNIIRAGQEGRIAAAQIIKELGLKESPKMDIVVMGDGPQTALITQALVKNGYPTYFFGQVPDQTPGIKDLSPAKILSIDGAQENFSILYDLKGEKHSINCGAIIAAPQAVNRSNTQRFPAAIDLGTFTRLTQTKVPDKVLILLDYFGPESKTHAAQALAAALAAQKAGSQVDIIMNKVLVHGPLGQQVYDQARTAGIGFFRYQHPKDLKITPKGKGVEVVLKETTLPGLELALEAHTLVIPDTLCASPEFQNLADLLKLGLDDEGFLQEANARHRPVHSQRKGVFFAGSGHDDIDKTDLAFEIQAILADLETWPGKASPPLENRMKINEKDCAKCLTCYRVCPHGAVVLKQGQSPQIIDHACFACQACMSNCPAQAITSSGMANKDLTESAQKGKTIIFACERSAALAAGPLETNMVSIPCACRISPDMILKALIRGADKVMVFGCHRGNCQSGQGSELARKGIEAVLSIPGIPRDKVTWQPISAMEPFTFTRIVSKA